MCHKSFRGTAVASLAMLALLIGLVVPAAAQNTGSIKGQVIDPEGKPWAGLTVKLSNDRGQKFETKTDAEGVFKQGLLAAGIWMIQIYHGEQLIREHQMRLTTGQEGEMPVINFKELIEADPKFAEEKKKQQAERDKFETMKAHFDAGVAAMQSADSLQNSLGRTPAEQKAAVQQQVAESRGKAIAEFEAAQLAVEEKDPNYSLILGNLGAAYKASGRFEESIQAYTRALAVKPDAGFYVGLAESQARTNKSAEAMATCGNIPVATHAANAATCYRNLGIVFYNTSKFAEAIEPLQKATQLEPKNAQAWYVLGASLVPLADFKDEKGKLVMTPKPGTIEAYEKAIELDPNGPYGKQAQEGLEQLKAMGAGIETKVRAGKRRN
jgi:tetratricopeptide (TPR) repeat protein